MELKDKLSTLRKEKGFSQLDLAELLGVSRQAISRWEVGSSIPTTENLKAISKLYGISVDDLITGSGNINPIQTRKEDEQKKKTSEGRVYNRKFKIIIGIIVLLAIISGFIISAYLNYKHRNEKVNSFIKMDNLMQRSLDQHDIESGEITVVKKGRSANETKIESISSLYFCDGMYWYIIGTCNGNQ